MQLLKACAFLLLPALCLGSLTFKEKLVAENIEIDTQWVDKDAHRQLDIVIVLDQSGSVGPRNFLLAKQWIREFLNFFSISQQYSQVGLVLFSTQATMAIPLVRDGNKCDFLTKLDKIPFNGGATNMEAGLAMSKTMLHVHGRAEIDRKLVVLISDGWYSVGGAPDAHVTQLKAAFPKLYLMVVAIGEDYATHYAQMLNQFVSVDMNGNPMMFGLKDFKQFAHVAYYFHKGDQKSVLYPSKTDMCGGRCNQDSKATCMCDSLGRGAYQCACSRGYQVQVTSSADLCAACPIGQTSSSQNPRQTCYKCPNPELETTLQTGSYSPSQCICKDGYSNIADPLSRTPPCQILRCPDISAQQLSTADINTLGTCDNLFNSKCTFGCRHGYKPINKAAMTITCDKSGRWSSALPKCSRILCPILAQSTNAMPWKCSPPAQGMATNVYGASCSTTCKDGYYPSQGTSSYRVCNAQGAWTEKPIICAPRSCPVLPTLTTGIYSYKQCFDSSLERSVGIVCSVSCKSGFKQRGDAIKFTCLKSGNWDRAPAGTDDQCIDSEPPTVPMCGSFQHQMIINSEGQATGNLDITIPSAIDNSGLAPDVSVSVKTTSGTFSDVDVSKPFAFPIGDNLVTFTFTDNVGNHGYCSYHVTVNDVESPDVLSCDGPTTADQYGNIYTDDFMADVAWPEPTFSDNSGVTPKLYTVTKPGEFRLGSYTIQYTARDDAGNEATCSFIFTVTGIACPQLHVPENGAMSCDKMQFGTYCLPQCEAGLTFFLPEDMTFAPREYLCTLKGTWRPHAYVPDCSVRNVFGNNFAVEYEGECGDEIAIKQIKQNAFNAMMNSIAGSEIITSSGLNMDDIHVTCGKKGDIIGEGTGARKRRAVEAGSKQLRRSKRGLTAEDLKNLEKLLKEQGVNIRPTCGVGEEMRYAGLQTFCYKCPGGMFWSSDTRKCVNCPVGSYSADGAIDACTSCPPGTSTASTNAGNSSMCHETCSPGYFSTNGMMVPKSCSACAIGSYTDQSKATSCQKCPSGTSTVTNGARDSSMCKAFCSPGFYSDSGLQTCSKCPVNTYQSSSGQKSCTECNRGMITQGSGSTSPQQCLIVDECQSSPCRNGGRCVDGLGDYSCVCQPGWAGKSCETNIDDCMPNPCWAGASCLDRVNGFQCVCPSGFSGTYCHQKVDMCRQSPCKNGGVCSNLIGDYECSCQAGYGGKDCSVNQPDCTPGICENGGRCIDKVNGFSCVCASGFRGELCSENINDCAPDSCQNGGTCRDGVNGVSCSCAPGFMGSRCETNVNECSSNPCQNGAVCTDDVNTFQCTCTGNWGGKQCGTVLSNKFDLAMDGNTADDYVVYDPASPLLEMPELTIRFSMKSDERGLQAHYGTVLSYGVPGQTEPSFHITLFPEQMFAVNGDDWLSGVDATNNEWNQVCMTWRASDGIWRAYMAKPYTYTQGLRLVHQSTNEEPMSKGSAIPGGGKIIIGQRYNGVDVAYPEQNIYQGSLNDLSIYFRYDQCLSKSTPDLTWANLVRNGNIVMTKNTEMFVDGKVRG